jgi:hypothetical protein
LTLADLDRAMASWSNSSSLGEVYLVGGKSR